MARNFNHNAPQHKYGNIIGTFIGIFAALFFGLVPGTANAQVVEQYTNSTDSAAGEISGTTACSVAAAFQRDFFVGDSFSVQDVNLGVLFAHGERDDTAIFLRSPAGTITTLKVLTGGTADNFNVLLDDEAGAGVGTHTNFDTATAGTAVPPYEETFVPANSLDAAYVGQDSVGIWTLFICDFAANGIDGTFFQADLFLERPSNAADLSLSKTVSSGSPSTAIFTLSVTNSAGSDLVTNGVQVSDILPAGVTFASASGTGTYNSGTGIWDIGTVAIGQTVSIDITVNVTAPAGTVITNSAEIIASSAPDPDSTVNNGVTTEDDFDSVSFTVGGRLPGVAPNIATICSVAGVGITVLDWNNLSAGEGWTPGTLSQSFTVPNIGTVNFDVSTEGTFNAPLALTLDNNGGLGGAGLSLFQSIEYTNIDEVTTTVITLPTAVAGLQFTVFDVDFGVNDFADRLQVIGTFNGGLPSSATLTNGAVNFISGNEARGDGGADGNTNDGDVVVTFTSPVDTITIEYGNHSAAPADPDGQAVSIHDFTFCTPTTTLSVTKISQVVNDPVNGTDDPKALPGATVRYCILVTNSGTGTAENVAATDALPPNVTFITGSLQSGANCSGALTAEDDDATGADETDPFGLSFDPAATAQGSVTGVANSLAPASNFAMIFNVTVD